MAIKKIFFFKAHLFFAAGNKFLLAPRVQGLEKKSISPVNIKSVQSSWYENCTQEAIFLESCNPSIIEHDGIQIYFFLILSMRLTP